jgi:hypothetical protein
MFPQVDKLRVGEAHTSAARVEALHNDETFRVSDWQHAQQRGVNQREYGRVGAYAQSDAKYGDYRKSRTPQQRPHCIPEVLPKLFE